MYEREQYTTQYGNFSGRVNWAYCFLEVDSPFGKHYLQGDGSSAGLLENIVITFDDKGRHNLQDQSGDQWTMFGRRGSELLLMRDCSGEAVAVFARAPYWPSTTDLYAILHRSGITQLTRQRVLCEPLDLPTRHCFMNNYYTTKKVEIP
ncbi:uncharacterized protein LOC126369888 [Pectinophora gossypiella]|uniref:uncharacterized protein LOC126369888 n=1 Tax=Pectinophora gossypiella TaxID=13191 RepID=UPI00214E56D0|nr:uncharacterized protein LOC126369888 [Pectinophora gossypiella]